MSFNITNGSLADSSSFVNTIFNDYYPGGKSPVKNTSAALAPPVLGRTLSTVTVSSMINGDIFSRHPKYATKALSTSVSTSLNTLITGGASIASESFNQPVNNPETQYESEDSIKLTGAAAYNRIIAESIAGKNLGMSFVEESISNMQEIELERYLGEEGGTGPSTETGTVNPSAEMQSAGSRDVALVSQLSEEEKSWFQERLALLQSKYSSIIGDKSKINGFSFDIPDQWAGGPLAIGNGTDTFFPDAIVRRSTGERILSDEFIKSPAANAYICPALIELLLLLHEKNYYIGGSLDAGRSPQKYYDKAVQDGEKETYLSDHTFGRAIDIFRVGRLNSSDIIELGTVPPKERYDSAVQILIEALADVPQYLMPDLIVVSSDLQSDYGTVSGNEPMTAPIKLNKPYLEYVNFHAASDHRNHIHLSFSGMRSGRYVGPGGAMVISGTQLSSQGTSSSGSGVGSSYTDSSGRTYVDEFGFSTLTPLVSTNIEKNYYGNWGASLTRLDVFNMLRTTGFSDEAAAIFAAIIARESGGSPTSCNPNALTGDFMSLGFFQINMGVGGYRKRINTETKQSTIATGPKAGAAHGRKSYELTENGKKEILQGWQIAVKNWESVFPKEPKPTIDNYNKVISEKYESLRASTGSYNATVEIMRELVDHRFWIPKNQGWALYTFRTGQPPQFGAPKLGSTTSNGYQFGAWGDYDGKQPYGWIGGVSFAHAVEVYKTIGKTEKNLKDWLKAVYVDDPATYGNTVWSRAYLDRWLNGEIFK